MSKYLTIELYEITREKPKEASLALANTFDHRVLADLKRLAQDTVGFKVVVQWYGEVELVTNFKNGNYKIRWVFDLVSKNKKDHFTNELATRFWDEFKKWMIGYESPDNRIYWNQSGFVRLPLANSEKKGEESIDTDKKKLESKKAPRRRKKPAKKTERNSSKRPGRTWLVYGSDYNYEQLMDEDLESINWTIHKDAEIGDWVYFYIRAPISAIVASGRVTSRPKLDHEAEQFSSVMPYFANIELYNVFENPLTYYQMYDDHFIFDRWSLVRSQMQSSRGPQQVPYSVLQHMDCIYDLRPY